MPPCQCRPTAEPAARRTSRLLSAIALAGAVAAGPTAAQEIVIEGPDRPITAPGGGDLLLVEPHTAVHPSDPDHVLVGAIAVAPDRGAAWHCAAFVTFDGGDTWSRTDFEMERCIDPWVLLREDGTALSTGIEIRSDGEGDGRFRLLLRRSRDGGRTWEGPAVDLGRTHEHAMLADGPPDATGRIPVYLVSRTTGQGADGRPYRQVHVARSLDAGRGFERLTEIRPTGLDYAPSGLGVLSDGSPVVAFYDYQREPDDGRAWTAGRRWWVVRSRGSDRDFTKPAPITDRCGVGESGFPGYPALAVDTTDGRFRDRLYHACIRPRLDGVAVTHTLDAADVWAPLVRVDTPPGRGKAHARTPMLAVDRHGVLGVSWYDRRNDPERECQDLYFTASTDGGATFAEPVRVSTETSCPNAEGNGSAGRSWPMGGDYGSIAAAPDGTFRLVWADSRDGRFRLRTAVVRVEDDGLSMRSYRRARAAVDRALAVMGDPDRVGSAGGIVVRAEGVMNQGAERQGRRPETLDPAPFRERLAVDPASGRAAWEYRHQRYDGTSEWLREVYREPGRQLLLFPDDRFAVELVSPRFDENRRKVRRRIPHLLLAEVITQPTALRWLGESGGGEVVSAALDDGTTVTLRFGPDRGLLLGVEYLTDVQTFGDATVAWRFDDYRPLDGLGLFPRRYGVFVEGRPFTEMTVQEASLGVTGIDEMSRVPDGFRRPGARELPSEPDPTRNARVDTVAPGVFRVVDLRGGFHPMFVEFETFVVAIDAPAGYALLNELPAGDVAPGPSSAWLSERFIELIRETAPDKPVRYVVLTHFHNDHAGGLRAFIARGATVLAAPSAARAVERLATEAHTIAPDSLARAQRPLGLEVVDGRRTIVDASRTLEILDVGENPHTDQMLVVHLPGERIVYVSDLLTPTSDPERFPTPSHAELDRWFARWLDDRGLDPTRVYTMHGSGLATREHLERLRPTSDSRPSGRRIGRHGPADGAGRPVSAVTRGEREGPKGGRD